MNTQHHTPRHTCLLMGTAGAVATGLVGSLVAATVATAAAAPTRQTDEMRGGRTAVPVARISTACFITPLTWNTSLDGPLPRCYRYLP